MYHNCNVLPARIVMTAVILVWNNCIWNILSRMPCGKKMQLNVWLQFFQNIFLPDKDFTAACTLFVRQGRTPGHWNRYIKGCEMLRLIQPNRKLPWKRPSADNQMCITKYLITVNNCFHSGMKGISFADVSWKSNSRSFNIKRQRAALSLCQRQWKNSV